MSREIREELEDDLEGSRKMGERLQAEVKEGEGKAFFLNFTQEQLASQVKCPLLKCPLVLGLARALLPVLLSRPSSNGHARLKK